MKIYVGNLSYDATEGDLRELFEAHGQVDTTTIIQDRYTGRSRGFGFVEMSNSSEAEAAIEALNGNDHKGRRLNVNEARSQSDAPRREDGGGRDRGGRW